MKKLLIIISLISLLALFSISLTSAQTNCTTNEDCPNPALYYCNNGNCLFMGDPDMSNCTSYYWFDNEHDECGYKQFCGAYMYYGLQVFESRRGCESALNGTGRCLQQDTTCCKNGRCESIAVDCIEVEAVFKGCDYSCKPQWECPSKNESNHNKKNITFVPWQKRNESECLEGCECHGAVMSCPTEDGKIMTITAGNSGNVITVVVNHTEVNTTLEVTQESENNKTKIKVKLVSWPALGEIPYIRNAEIKIMPDTASERAIERLGQLNFTIELKQVGYDKVAYELTGNKQGKFLGIFKIMAKVQAQIDAETGNVKVIKPWWRFLALGI